MSTPQETRSIYNQEELNVALIAAILKHEGTLDISFEAFGEASVVAKLGSVRPAMERTATGLRFVLAQPESYLR